MVGDTKRLRFRDFALASAGLVVLTATLATAAPAGARKKPDKHDARPNILFFIMDDVGIDQMKVFGYGGATPPSTPNIDAIAGAGVRFRNAWAMPECSPSRSAVFTGRFPLRTNIQAVVSSSILANSQVSPFEVTTPKVLETNAGYDSALFGKFHLAGPDNNPFGNGGPHSIGWDYFYGWIEGEPYPVDTYAGQKPADGDPAVGPYLCGYVGGSAAGVCRFADGACEPVAGLRPGLSCVARGGLFDQGGNCASPSLRDLDFERANAYYVSPLVINHPDGTVVEVPYTDSRTRGYRTTLEVDAARDWIRQQDPNTPWMATVAFSSAHVPYQPAPPSFALPGLPDPANPDCTTEEATRTLSNQTIEAMDKELGRLLVELGIASRGPGGELVYDPAASNTMIVILGDNGTYATVVKPPFDPLHSKGTAYQTGVWVPLIVSGPLVVQPDREVSHVVNAADLFALFGEIADVDVHKVVPKSHVLDAVSMLPYLTNPTQKSLRKTNFTQSGTSITKDLQSSPPCVIPLSGAQACVELFPNAEVCRSEGGQWFGEGAPVPYADCCGVKNACEFSIEDDLRILPTATRAIRNEHYKLLEKDVPDCGPPPPCASQAPSGTVTEFYEINEAPVFPQIERPDGDSLPPNNLLPPGTAPGSLSPVQRKNYRELRKALDKLLASEIACPGDGNLDKRVDQDDLSDWEYFQALSSGTSTWYDFDYDGLTNEDDRDLIEENLGARCVGKATSSGKGAASKRQR